MAMCLIFLYKRAGMLSLQGGFSTDWLRSSANRGLSSLLLGPLHAQCTDGTDKLPSYVKPIKTLAQNTAHRAHKDLSNANKASHRPPRKREKIFDRFKSHRQAQRILSAHDPLSLQQGATAGQWINLIFRLRRYQLTAISYRHARRDAFSLWVNYTVEMAA